MIVLVRTLSANTIQNDAMNQNRSNSTMAKKFYYVDNSNIAGLTWSIHRHDQDHRIVCTTKNEADCMAITEALNVVDEFIVSTEKELDQARVQLAGCGVAALGGINDVAKQGQYGWSPAYEDTLKLRQAYEKLRYNVEHLLQDVFVMNRCDTASLLRDMLNDRPDTQPGSKG
jgi:hypothetical protein